MDRASIVSLFPYTGRGLINFFSDVYYMVLYSAYCSIQKKSRQFVQTIRSISYTS